MMNKKADMGIGTLVIFIAMILVAAIAAGVLIQTATSLQNRALLTGSRTQEQVGTALEVLQVYAEDGQTNNSLDYFNVKFKLAPGSEPIRLNDTLLEFDTSDNSAFLTYNNTGTGSCESADYSTDSEGEGVYSGRYLVESGEHSDGYVHRGDVVELCFETPDSVQSDDDVSIRITPRVGVPSTTETAIPEIIGQSRIYIYP